MKYDYHKCWQSEVVKKYFTTESREKDEQAFSKTHVPIDKVRVEFCKDLPTAQFVSEQEFLELITKSVPNDHNRIFLLVGETGSGKSELCQWLDYNIKDGVHVPIHISRSDTKLQRIAELLDERMRAINGSSKTDDFEPIEYGDLSVVEAGDIADLLKAEIVVRLNELKDKKDAEVLKSFVRQQYFLDKLASEIKIYQQNLIDPKGKERAPVVLTEQWFNMQPLFGQLNDKKRAYHFVNRSINTKLKEFLNAHTIVDKLRLISREYARRSKRPVLLLEDLTSFSVLAEDLIDLLFDLPSGHFDVVIGWTTGFERAHTDFLFKAADSMTYIRERIRGRFIMTDEEGSAFFLETHYMELAKKYLMAVKSKDCRICMDHDAEQLYPFNMIAIKRVYENLQQDGVGKRTPRLLLEFVMRMVLNSSEPPWRSLSTSGYLKPVQSLVDASYYKKDQDMYQLMQWYGLRDDGYVVIPATFTRLFGIESETGGELRLPALETELGSVLEEQRGLKKGVPAIPGKETPEEALEKIMTEFQQWYNHDKKFLNRDILRKAVIELVRQIADPCEIKSQHSRASSGLSIRYERGAEAIPTYIENSGDDNIERDLKLNVSKTAPYKLLHVLLNTSITSSSIPEKYLFSLTEWGKEVAEEYNQRLRSDLKKALGMTIEEFVLVTKFLLLNLLEGLSTLDAAGLKRRIVIDQAYNEHIDLTPIFKTKQKIDQAQDFINQTETIEGLFASFFMMTDSIFDTDAIASTLSKVDLISVIKTIRQIDENRIRDAFKIGTRKDSRPLRALVATVSQYASNLYDVPFGSAYNNLQSQIKQVYQMIPAKTEEKELVSKKEKLLQALGTLAIPLTTNWQSSLELMKDDSTMDWESLRSKLHNLTNMKSKPENVAQYIALSTEFYQAQKMPEHMLLQTLSAIVIAINAQLDQAQKSSAGTSADSTRIIEVLEKMKEAAK